MQLGDESPLSNNFPGVAPPRLTLVRQRLLRVLRDLRVRLLFPVDFLGIIYKIDIKPKIESNFAALHFAAATVTTTMTLAPATLTTDWLLRIGDGENFRRSSKSKIWGIKSTTPACKHFVNHAKPGDRLWFVTGNSSGMTIAVATYKYRKPRELGPLVNVSMTNEELGWTGPGSWDTEIHYTDLYDISKCELLTNIKGPSTIRKYDLKCNVELAVEYSYMVRYSKATLEL